MRTSNEDDLVRGLMQECQELKQRLTGAERRIRWVGALLLAAAVLPFLIGAFSTNDEIVLRDAATGNVRILLKAGPNGGAWMQINAPDGSKRIFLGQDSTNVPRLVIFKPDGQAWARDLSP